MLSNNNKVKHIAPSDPEPPVQEQALALLCNLVDGCINSIEFVYDEDGLILDTVGRQLRKAPQAQMAIQVTKNDKAYHINRLKRSLMYLCFLSSGYVCAHECV